MLQKQSHLVRFDKTKITDAVRPFRTSLNATSACAFHSHNLFTALLCLLSWPAVGWFTVAVVALCVPAALGYLQDRCQGRASEAELRRRHHHAVYRKDLHTVHLTRQEAMQEVKYL